MAEKNKAGVISKNKPSVILLTVVVAIAVLYFIASAYFPQTYGAEIADASRRTGLDENLIRAVIWTESKFDEAAVSAAGASGLMQMTDETREFISLRTGVEADGSAESEIFLGSAYLQYLINRCGNEKDALMSYNAGYGNVMRWKEEGGEPYPETREYVKRVEFARRMYEYVF